MRSLAISAAFCWLAAAVPAAAATIPDCAGGVEVARAHVMRVEKNGALILNDGRAMLLEGIRLPLHDGGPPGLADDALGQLRDLAMAGPLTLTSTPPKEDRYDRVRVQAFGNSWLQMELLRRGLARVEISPDRSECAPDLYETEQTARTAHVGLWAYPAFAVKTPQSVRSDSGFIIVEGRVADVASRDGRMVLNFRDGNGFSAMIAPEDARAFRDMDPSPGALAGRRIRLRGMVVDDGGRPQIALSNPAQIELLN